VQLLLARNKLSGEVPESLSHCRKLECIDLTGNLLEEKEAAKRMIFDTLGFLVQLSI
jgi:hypothetical protein